MKYPSILPENSSPTTGHSMVIWHRRSGKINIHRAWNTSIATTACHLIRTRSQIITPVGLSVIGRSFWKKSGLGCAFVICYLSVAILIGMYVCREVTDYEVKWQNRTDGYFYTVVSNGSSWRFSLLAERLLCTIVLASIESKYLKAWEGIARLQIDQFTKGKGENVMQLYIASGSNPRFSTSTYAVQSTARQIFAQMNYMVSLIRVSSIAR